MTEKIKVFSYLDRPPQNNLKCPELSRTHQEFLEDSDINVIVRKYADCAGFVDPSVPRKRKPVYGDFADLGDLQDHMNNVIKVQEIFADLPAEVRIQFENDPIQFAQFASDQRNITKLMDLGVIDRPDFIELKDVAKATDISTEKMETITSEEAKD